MKSHLSSMAHSYYGKIESKTSGKGNEQERFDYKIAKFEFQIPILINGSAKVEVEGLHSLSISSTEGIFIGVKMDVGRKSGGIARNVGGYCVNRSEPSGTVYVQNKFMTSNSRVAVLQI